MWFCLHHRNRLAAWADKIGGGIDDKRKSDEKYAEIIVLTEEKDDRKVPRGEGHCRRRTTGCSLKQIINVVAATHAYGRCE